MRECREIFLTDLPETAAWVLNSMSANILAIEGEMGAGKTTFVKELCKQLEIPDNVSSPTFSLVNEYFSPERGAVYHFDLYRLKSAEEAMDIGIEEYLHSDSLCIIEWPEKIRNLLPAETLWLQISVTPADTRVFELIQPTK